MARRSLVLEGSPLSIQEAWAIEVGDGAPHMDMAKELTDRDALCYRQNIWRNGDIIAQWRTARLALKAQCRGCSGFLSVSFAAASISARGVIIIIPRLG